MTRRSLHLELVDEDASLRFGQDVALALERGDVIALDGDLGVGKTTIARAVIRTLAGDPDLEVPSPTFTLVQAYGGRIPLQHFDLYRLSSADEMEELGFSEAVREGVVLVEWPHRATGVLPEDSVTITLAEAGAGRVVSVSGPDSFMDRLERSLAIRRFLDASGLRGASRRFLIGDASSRSYETVSVPGRESVILMNAPRRPDGRPVRNGISYSRIAHLAESVIPFVAIDISLRKEGFAAPAISAADLDTGLLLIEYLGNEGVLDAEGNPIPERYVAAVEMLAEMHRRDWPQKIEVADGVHYEIPRYDNGAMAIETELLIDWYMPHIAGRVPTPAEHEAFVSAWRGALARLDRAEHSLVLRDYHSPNIIWRPDRAGHDRIGLIDFQDAVLGPVAYDVASLAMDARVTIAAELERRIVDAYRQAREARGGFDRAAFDEAYAIVAAQRASKILGIFVRLNVRDGKPNYLKHLSRLRDYVNRALAHPSLSAIRALYEELGFLEEPR